ncbi:hypothetical protein [Variovorax terrae]|uniref:Uncharacterized protein n=1 Tax=Variovorax terrae TaxID=2923278 RepID=A0A9X1VUM6_9BURK|nr:hypothetical protein [Variovorax terrae]MCJ0764171.1 hypothetical protein [Variovorax terrae]
MPEAFAVEAAPIAVDEVQAAKAISLSVHWLRMDRRTKRLIPFYKVGGAIRYNLTRVREALAALEEGGPPKQKRTPSHRAG